MKNVICYLGIILAFLILVFLIVFICSFAGYGIYQMVTNFESRQIGKVCVKFFDEIKISIIHNTIDQWIFLCVTIAIIASATIIAIKGLNMFRDIYEDKLMHDRFDKYRMESSENEKGK